MAERYYNPHLDTNAGYGRAASDNTIDLAQAGTQQFAANLGKLGSNTPYVRRNVIPFLIEAPRFFEYTSNPDMMVRALKAVIETHTRTIDGLNRQLTVDSAENPYGGSGEVIQTPTNITRARSNPTHGMWELDGRSITHFIHWWITYGIGDENTKTPLVVTNGQVSAADYDQTFFGATVLYVEPDATMTDVVSAWLCTNMYPTATPPWEGSKDASQLGQQLDVSLEFTAATDVSLGTKMFARELIQNLSLGGLNPNENPAWLESVSADVQAASNGLKSQLEEGANQRVSY